jgi:serine/threonine protein kinase
MELSILGDRYEVQQRLSKKTGRQTYLALDRQTQNLVIVKLLIFGYDFDWNDLTLFEREADILKTLNHPAIPQYQDSFGLDLPNLKGFAFVQTYIDAKSLEAHLQAHRTFSEAEVKQISEDILEVLIYLHNQNPPIIHRDIKPSNILLANRSAHSAGQVYVVDFGSVQNSISVEGCTWTVAGTYGYAPLEQFSGRAIPVSDLYGLGATLIHLVTGQHPADLSDQDLRIQFAQTTSLSPSLKRWLRQMTEPSSKRRFGSSQEALQALKALQPEDEMLATSKPTGSKILLTKSAEELQILIPPLSVRQQPNRSKFLEKARKSDLVPSFARSLPSPLFILLLVILGIYYSVIFLLCLLLPILGWGLALVILVLVIFAPFILIASYARVQLRLIKDRDCNQNYVSLHHEFLGLKLCKYSSLFHRDQVRLQQLNPKIVETDEADQISCRSVLSELIIWVDNQKYVLGDLTPLELDWLSQELSDWLDLPVEHIQIPAIQKILSKKESAEISVP